MGNSFIKKPQLLKFCCLFPDLLFGSPQSYPHSRFGMLGNKPGIAQRWVRRRQQAVAGHGRLSDASHLGFEKRPGSELDGRHRKQRSDAFKASYRRMPSPQLPGRCRLPRVLGKRSVILRYRRPDRSRSDGSGWLLCDSGVFPGETEP
jgi:hypothetical protein